MRKVAIIFVVLVVTLCLATLVYAPYLPRLIAEPLPPLTVNPQSTFANLPAAKAVNALKVGNATPQIPPNKRLQSILSESGAKALVAAHNGQLKLEYYAEGVGTETKFNSYSTVKSLVAALVFKALSEGHISSLDTTLAKLLPEAPGVDQVTLRALLTMRSGIKFERSGDSVGTISGAKLDDPAPNPFGGLAQLHFSGLKSIEKDLKTSADASGVFAYQNINTALLAKVLEKIYGQSIHEILVEKLWHPAGAGAALWRKPHDKAGVSAYCCLYATPRDFVRIGIYLASNGTANAPFLPEPLWREFLGLDVALADLQSDNYGMHVHQNILDRDGQQLQGPFSYFIGQNGQMLYLMPSEGLVVYRAGEKHQLLHSTLYETWNTIGGQ